MKIKYIYLIIVSMIALNINAQSCNGRYQTEIFTNINVSTVNYGLADGQTLQMDIYQAEEDTAANRPDRPVIIFCFGGSFLAGSRTSPEIVAFATDFAKRGYVTASIDYRLASSLFALLQEENIVKTVFKAVQDGKAAIRYFRKDARFGNALGIDSNQIFIGGTSAGGILGMNLAYADDTSEIPSNQKVWLEEIGGMEGNSGNPGYCSKPAGVFGFAGAVADTAYLDETDVPFYGCHATGDQTVLYDYGPPINPAIPVSLYGSGNLETRMNNLGIYNVLDTYSGSDHPPLGGGNYTITLNNFSNFLFNILDCNPNNEKKIDQKKCEIKSAPTDSTNTDTTTIDTTNVSIFSLQEENVVLVYPNPVENVLYLKSELNIDAVQIVDVLARVVYKQNIEAKTETQINVSAFDKGIFYLKIKVDGKWFTEKIYLK